MNPQVQIRQATPKDYAEIVAVVNSEYERYAKVYTKAELDLIGIGVFKVEDLRSGESERAYLLAVDEERVVGFASWYIKPNNVAWLSMLQVLPQDQGRGVGGSLIQRVEWDALRMGACALALEVQEKARWATEFYVHKGFKALTLADLNSGIFARTMATPAPVAGTLVYGKVI